MINSQNKQQEEEQMIENDLKETFLSQYANSPILCGIIERFNAACDPSTLIENFLKNIFNPDTATGWGLDVWGRIVGVGRVLKVPADAWFGFIQADDGTQTITPFDDRQFYLGGVSAGNALISNNYVLTDDAYRKLIYAKAASNITSGSIQNINALLMQLFGGEGRALWIEEDAPLLMKICYNFHPSPVDAVIIENSGILPRPSGVRISYEKREPA